jgi:hypothetical protein
MQDPVIAGCRRDALLEYRNFGGIVLLVEEGLKSTYADRVPRSPMTSKIDWIKTFTPPRILPIERTPACTITRSP